MMTGTEVDWRLRAAELTAELSAAGVLPPEWESAFRNVPRHLFVPRILLDGETVEAGSPGWLDHVYADEPLVTRRQGGVPTSSSSRPTVMAVMLARLAARPGHRVLEIGTGTGYNTAILRYRLGDEQVFSIDIDSGLVGTASAHLAEVRFAPRLVAGDGAVGWAEHGPYDRILATCAITRIPAAWIEQLADGGRIVAPLDAGEAGPLLVLNKIEHDEVSGRIDPYPVHFMPLRARVDDPLGSGESLAWQGTGTPHYGTTALDPAKVTAGGFDLALWLWLHAPGLRIAASPEQGQMYLYTRDSLAQVSLAPGSAGAWPVQQRGAARLWDTVEHAYTAWTSLGLPGPGRLGVAATTEHQFVWLDDPDGTHSWPLGT